MAKVRPRVVRLLKRRKASPPSAWMHLSRSSLALGLMIGGRVGNSECADCDWPDCEGFDAGASRPHARRQEVKTNREEKRAIVFRPALVLGRSGAVPVAIYPSATPLT